MDTKIAQTLTDRKDYLVHLKEGLEKLESSHESVMQEIRELEKTLSNINLLGSQPQFEGLIPLTKNMYMSGRLIHTGEYYLDRNASPNSYSTLATLEQTLDSVKRRISNKTKITNTYMETIKQINERITIMQQGDVNDVISDPETRGMPEKIVSEKGVALKVGELYEIVEFDS